MSVKYIGSTRTSTSIYCFLLSKYRLPITFQFVAHNHWNFLPLIFFFLVTIQRAYTYITRTRVSFNIYVCVVYTTHIYVVNVKWYKSVAAKYYGIISETRILILRLRLSIEICNGQIKKQREHIHSHLNTWK